MRPRSAAVACLLALSTAALAEDLVPDDAAAASAAAGYGRAFGRVRMIEDGKPVDFSSFAVDFMLRLRSLATDEAQRMTIRGDGRFDWPLKPGEYVLQSFYRNGTVRLWAPFAVPAAGKAVYLGDLAILAEQQRYLIGIEDRFDEAVRATATGHAEAKMEPVKALTRLEKEPGTFKRVVHACAGAWGLECSRIVQGLEATLPEGTHNDFPSIAGRTPLFEWKPAPGEGVTYDLAVYDAFLANNLLGTIRERGKLVHYAEGLREPRFQLPVELAADRHYLWSVRLRKGDTVSTWTTTGYAAFFVIGYAVASGRWYGFRTAEK